MDKDERAHLKRFYDSASWHKLRIAILVRDNYECQQCKCAGKHTHATEVHHIVPIRKDYSLRLEPSNLVALCKRCHYEIHHKTSINKGSHVEELCNRFQERWD